jgi:hypothetical protein
VEYFRDFVATALPDPDPYQRASKWLWPGDVLFSATRAFKFIFQMDGNVVLYVIDDTTLPVDITQGQYTNALWATGTTGMGGALLAMQTDGNLVLYAGQIAPPSSGLGSDANYFLSNNCTNLTGLTVTIDVTQDIVLESSGAASETVLWASNTAGNPGAFLRCQDDGNLVMIASNGRPITSSNVYAG